MFQQILRVEFKYISVFVALFLGAFLIFSGSVNSKNVEDGTQIIVDRKMVLKEYNYSMNVMPVKVTVHPSEKDLNQAFKKYYHINPNAPVRVVGWYDVVNGVCEIHVLDIVYVKDDPNMATWGHELAHCVYGKFH